MRFPTRIRLDPAAYEQSGIRMHLVFAAHPKITRWPGTVGDAIWGTVRDIPRRNVVDLHAACLMPDHLHLLVGCRERSLLVFANAFKSWTTRESWKHGNGHGLWQPGMWDRTIRDEEDYAHTWQYIVDNPVVAGLVDDPNEWPWTFMPDGRPS